MFRTVPRMAGFVFRENRVPYYQRLFQQHDGKRQWWKTERSKYLMYPYLLSVYGLGIVSLARYDIPGAGYPRGLCEFVD
ncbi:hypothetical protein IFM46972_05241 [Aspergillus udagawae]|uniref:Uncharacterized protein n=1 Tax=Aspergillus udagawae TaxID=91492 RepID=A0A8H3NPL8_9EURO|nr:hypothetical protein IFM46972_05241 [Aspergillus udagawae]